MGVENFLIYAEENSEDRNKIPCPCGRCANFKKFSIKTIRGHIYDNGFFLGYVHWVWHGETASTGPKSSSASCPPEEQAPDPPPEQASDEASEQDQEHVAASETVDVCEATYNSGQYDNDSYQFRRFVADAEQPLYEGSDCTKLESMLKSHNWKSRFGITDSAFTDLLSSVGSLLPKDNVLPSNAYEAKKTLSNLGLEYIKFHSCPNDCVLYRGVHADATKCPKCRLSRWKLTKKGEERVNLPAKVMWYFPIIPRFKRMFKSPSTTELMCWHAQQRTQDGKMRHLADSPSWKNIDYRWPSFGSEPRNLRLALSADGVNPHNNGLSNRYSCWPVILVTYNLPPWLCMKRKFMMLSILVPGPHEPGNNIDIYLQPMIDDSKKLWKEGEPNVYDVYNKSFFTLKAVLMWTINDFPAYGNLSGCVNKGYKCCPVCGYDTVAKYLTHSRKMCYQGHRRYLPLHHPYRRQKAAFNRQQEFGQPRRTLSGEEVLAEQEQIKFEFGKKMKKAKKVESPWKKKSVFFELEYWKFHHVRHYIDAMHVEKNVCDSLIGTLLNMHHKTKDSAAARRDMIEMGVRSNLAPQVNDELRENNKGVSDTIRWLAAKPSFSVLTYQGYLVNGVRYFTKERDDIRVVQNSGVSVIAKAVQVSSAKDLNPVESDLTFYGIIQEIWELDYHAFKAPLSLCKWASNDKGIRVDDLGFTLVNFSRQGHKKDKYVSVDQVKQVFYLEDPVDATWSIVLSSTTRDYHELYNEDDLGDTIMEHPPFCTEIPATDVATDDVAHTARPNVEGIWIKNTATKTPAPNVVTD
ncbi:uncharacterized protein LOC141693054 [Apium graveolens]|uniref:uncharacterized protein LOC141693054 n=1 Tax=Apium graveolens TaxID=4045 RepID=UPI003D7A1205